MGGRIVRSGQPERERPSAAFLLTQAKRLGYTVKVHEVFKVYRFDG